MTHSFADTAMHDAQPHNALERQRPALPPVAAR